GAGAGGGPHVRVFSGATGDELMSFFAYAASFTGGVRVASGDVNGDGLADVVTAAGAGGGPHVKVFDGATGNELMSFFAYTPTFTGGVFVGSGDVNGDGFADIVTGAGAGGGPHVKVFDGATGNESASFFAYAPQFTGGVTVSAGDVNDDGHADIITGAGAGGGPHVKIFDGATGNESASFFAYDAAFQGGVFVAGGDPGERDPIRVIDQLVTAAEDAVSNGTLVGAGPGRSGPGRLNAWMSMLREARAKLHGADVNGACANLFNTHRRADGAPRPPDFVDGPATRELADRIRALGEDLGCGFPGPAR
ncbi:MAG TPA: VCBS repeat-containing protein, partial [Longimicrobiales bacterium]|nr:VCBS repeat-containing protein [Longimicrobiales bacterium]